MGLFDTLLDAVATSPAANQYRDIKMHNGLLPYIFSKADSLKRSVKDAVNNPADYLAKSAGTITDDPERFAGMMSGMAPGGVGIAGITSRVNPRSNMRAVAEGYFDPIGLGKKLKVPVTEMSATHVPTFQFQQKKVWTPEMFSKDDVFMPAVSDRSAGGVDLTAINSTQLPQAVHLQGGTSFMDTHALDGSVWASKTGKVRALANQAIRAADAGASNIYLPTVSMGHLATDFRHMPVDAALQMIRGSKISNKSKELFDDELRKLRPEWAGLDHPDAQSQLEKTGLLRTAFIDRMGLDEFQKRGFPDTASIRFAVTDPNQLSIKNNMVGYNVGKVDPSGIVNTNPVNPHLTYEAQLAGQGTGGGFDMLYPRELFWKDFFDKRRAEGAPLSGDDWAFARNSPPLQRATDAWKESLINYREKKLRGLLDD